MIRVLSRLADRSMFGLEHTSVSQSAKQSWLKRECFFDQTEEHMFDLLLHGGGQAGDPAILSVQVSTHHDNGTAGETYVALESALEDQLFGHGSGKG